MNRKRILEKISSKYILANIFDAIKENNFKLKLFTYSKLFQQKLELKLIDYQEANIIQQGMQLNKYLYSENNEDSKYRIFNKYILSKNLEKDLAEFKIDKTIFDNIVFNILNKNQNEIKNNSDDMDFKKQENKIEIYSPIFDIVSKLDIFETSYVLPISTKIIEKNNLQNDYISIFSKLNELNYKYSAIYFTIKDTKDIDYLKIFNINFNKLKKLAIIEDNFIKLKIRDYNYFFNTFFSFENIEKNLTYLNLDLFKHTNERIESSLMEKLNTFISLKYLSLSGFLFDELFIIKLANLKSLSIDNCNNINIEENVCLNLKELNLEESLIPKYGSLLVFPNLEHCNLFNLDYQHYYSLIDFKSLQKVKKFYGEICDFLYLEGKNLKEISLYSIVDNSFTTEKNMFEKIITLKKLVKLNIVLSRYNDEDISKIQGKNEVITDLEINWENNFDNCILYNLQKKFPNLSSLRIYIPFYEDFSCDLEIEPTLKIEENKSCKLNKFTICIEEYYNKSIQFYCCPYEDLIEVEFEFESNVKNLKDSFPIFNENCKTVFQSLRIFHFRIYNYENELNFEFFNNLYKNIDNMPKLEDFSLYCIKPLEDEFCKKFVHKLLHLNLKNINFTLKYKSEPDNPYSIDELKYLWPDVNFNKFNKLHIQKFY